MPPQSAIFVGKPQWLSGSFREMLRIEPRILVYQVEEFLLNCLV